MDKIPKLDISYTTSCFNKWRETLYIIPKELFLKYYSDEYSCKVNCDILLQFFQNFSERDNIPIRKRVSVKTLLKVYPEEGRVRAFMLNGSSGDIIEKLFGYYYYDQIPKTIIKEIKDFLNKHMNHGT